MDAKTLIVLSLLISDDVNVIDRRDLFPVCKELLDMALHGSTIHLSFESDYLWWRSMLFPREERSERAVTIHCHDRKKYRYPDDADESLRMGDWINMANMLLYILKFISSSIRIGLSLPAHFLPGFMHEHPAREELLLALPRPVLGIELRGGLDISCQDNRYTFEYHYDTDIIAYERNVVFLGSLMIMRDIGWRGVPLKLKDMDASLYYVNIENNQHLQLIDDFAKSIIELGIVDRSTQVEGSVTEMLGQFTELRRLQLCLWNSLNDDIYSELAEAIQNMLKLVEIDLRGSDIFIESDACLSIGLALGALPALERINLTLLSGERENRVNDSFRLLALGLGKSSSLRRVDMSGCFEAQGGFASDDRFRLHELMEFVGALSESASERINSGTRRVLDIIVRKEDISKAVLAAANAIAIGCRVVWDS